MQANKQQITVAILALGLAGVGVWAQETLSPEPERTIEAERDASQVYKTYDRTEYAQPAGARTHNIKASQLIGAEVKNDQGRPLGKIEDLILSPNYNVSCVVIFTDRTSGLGEKRIAVPVNDLNCGSDETLRLSASVDQLKNASRTPSGDWVTVSGDGWTRNIDYFYGSPTTVSVTESGRSSTPTYEREGFETIEREPVRTAKGEGARELMTHPEHANLFKGTATEKEEPIYSNPPVPPVRNPTDEAIQQRVADKVHLRYTSGAAQAISITVQNGVVTLRGMVASESDRRNIESDVRQMTGVVQVNNQLMVQTR